MNRIKTTVVHQNLMFAVRRELGWPGFRPANDCMGFCSGRKVDFGVGSERARLATMLGKDLTYSGWANATARRPVAITIIYRYLLTVDVIDQVVPYAANDDAPIMFVDTRAKEVFAIDERGSLIRRPGTPRDIERGRARAMKRVRATAAKMTNELRADSCFVPPGSTAIEPAAPVDTIVCFG